MCEFCKYGERNSITDSSPTVNDDSNIILNNSPEFWIQEARKEFAPDDAILICYNSLKIKDSDNCMDRNIIYSGIHINYCPICGRKLEKYE